MRRKYPKFRDNAFRLDWGVFEQSGFRSISRKADLIVPQIFAFRQWDQTGSNIDTLYLEGE
jgi:hypothetical protein